MMWFVGSLFRYSHLMFLQADPALLRLPAPGLRGTWARAYSLLTRLVSDIGWDELLKTRSVVFVMEEEYRMQKAQADIQKVVTSNGARNVSDDVTVIHEDGSVTMGSATLADDDASIRGMSSPLSESESKPEIEGGLSASAIPIIRVSSEYDTEREIAESTRNGIAEQDEVAESANMQSLTLEKPVQAAAGAEPEPSQPSNSNQEAFSFTNKRLCERWLDNLFMVLYEVRIIPQLAGRSLNPMYLPRTCGCGLSSEQKSHISKHSTLLTGKLASSGRSSET